MAQRRRGWAAEGCLCGICSGGALGTEALSNTLLVVGRASSCGFLSLSTEGPGEAETESSGRKTGWEETCGEHLGTHLYKV